MIRRRTFRGLFLGAVLVLSVVYAPRVAVPSQLDAPAHAGNVDRGPAVDTGLSVTESIGLLFATGNGHQWHLYRRANPNVKPYLYEVLESDELWRDHPGALILLGYVGDSRDAQRIEAMLRGWSGVLTRPQQGSALAIIRALGIMSRRGVAEATEILDRMLTVEYWKRTGIKWYPDEQGRDVASEFDGVYFAFVGHVEAERRDLDEINNAVLEQIEDRETRTRFERRRNFEAAREYLKQKHAQEMRDPTEQERGTLQRLFREYSRYFKDLGDLAPKPAEDGASAERLSPQAEWAAAYLETERVMALVARGDASAVPVLRRWLYEPLDTPGGRHLWAIQGLGTFRDRTVLEHLKLLYDSPYASVPIRDGAAQAIAQMATKWEQELLRRMMWEERLAVSARCAAAAALVQLVDDEGAREFLLLLYDLHRLQMRTNAPKTMSAARDQLRGLSDPRIIAALESRVDGESQGTMKRNILTLIESVRFNGHPLDTLKSFAADPAWAQASRRYAAITVLGRTGDSELIPFLESLRPWTGDDVPDVQQQLLQERIRAAIAKIRQRTWSEELPE